MHPNSLANLKPPKKGERRNPNGRPKGKTISEYARDELERVVDEKTGKTLGQVKAEEWIENAIASPSLFLALLDRLEGKVPNAVNVQNDGQLRVIIEHVGDAGNTD